MLWITGWVTELGVFWVLVFWCFILPASRFSAFSFDWPLYVSAYWDKENGHTKTASPLTDISPCSKEDDPNAFSTSANTFRGQGAAWAEAGHSPPALCYLPSMETDVCCPVGWQCQPSEPLTLGPRTTAAGSSSWATRTHPTARSCRPTSAKHVKSHPLSSTSTFRAAVPHCHSLLGRSVPPPAAACSQPSTCTELPAPGNGKDSGQKLLHDIQIQSSTFTCCIHMESGMLWSTQWSDLDEDTVETQLGEGKISSLINNSLKLKAELIVRLQFQLPRCLC